MEHLKVSEQIEIAIFAGNWVILSKTMNENEIFLEIQNINALIECNLTFTTEEIDYARIEGLTDRTVEEDEEIKKEKENSKEIKFLGAKW